MKINLMLGDCLEKMRELPDNSVDAIVTDPPYGLEFMGKDWDAPWKEKGVSGGKRTGFGEPDGSKFRQNRGTPSFGVVGNPTCLNCGGDKYRSGERKCRCENPLFPNQTTIQMRAFQSWVTEWATECFRVLKPGGHLLAFAGTRTHHRMCSGIEDAGFEIRDMIAWVYGSGFPKSHNLKDEWQGWGTALKPALEPITVARKPLIGTVAENVLTHGTGALNIDGCRVGTEDMSGQWDREWKTNSGELGVRYDQSSREKGKQVPPGRWPANLIHDGDQMVLDLFPHTVSGNLSPHHKLKASDNRAMSGGNQERSPRSEFGGDKGSAARFFYCAKASKKDRDEGVTNEPQAFVQFQTGNGASGKPSSLSEGRDTQYRNNHPTVKPTDLMRYLCRLVTPPGGTVLDPFMGSGSTGKAAVLEDFCFIGIERDEGYFAIAKQRIESNKLEMDWNDAFS